MSALKLPPPFRRAARAGALAGVVLVGLVVASVALVGRAQSPAPAGGAAPAPAPAQAPLLPVPPGTPPAPGATPKTAGDNVKIVFTTVPMKKAMVFWGKRRLGIIAPHAPLVVQRPRDSGPLDVMVRADGYLPVQTRAYTFGDAKVAVRLTALDQKNTLLGYREEVPPDADGGVPPAGGGGAFAPDGGR